MERSGAVSTANDDLWGADVSAALSRMGVTLGARSALLWQRESDGCGFGVVQAWNDPNDSLDGISNGFGSPAEGTMFELLALQSEQHPRLFEGAAVEAVTGRSEDTAVAALISGRQDVAVVLLFRGSPPAPDQTVAATAQFCDLAGQIWRRAEAETLLRRRLDMKRVLAEISTEFVSASADDIADEIDSALALLAEQFGCVIATIWDDGDDGKVHRSHVWVNSDLADVLDFPIEVIPFDHPVSKAVRSLDGPGMVDFSRHFGSAEPRRDQSIIGSPLTHDGVVTGAVTFAFQSRHLDDSDLEFWYSTAEGFAALVGQLRRTAGAELAERSAREMERAVNEIAKLFVEAPSSAPNDVIGSALEKLGVFLGAASVCYYRVSALTGESTVTAWWSQAPDFVPPSTVELSCTVATGRCADCDKLAAPVDVGGELVGAVVCDVRASSSAAEMMSALSALMSQYHRRVDAELKLAARQAADAVLSDTAAELIGTDDAMSRALDKLMAAIGASHLSLWRETEDPDFARRTRMECMSRAGDATGRSHAYLPASMVANYPDPGQVVDYPLDFVPKWLESVVGEPLEPEPRCVSIAVVQAASNERVALFVLSEGDRPADEIRRRMLSRATVMLAEHQARVAAEETFAAAFASAPTALTIRDRQGRLVACNDAYLEFTGRPREELIGDVVDSVLVDRFWRGEEAQLSQPVELPYRRPDGSVAWGRVQFNRLRLPGRAESVLLSHIEDITASRRANLLMLHRATHDSLTELQNRDGFFESLGADNATTGCAVLVVDLDRFGAVNDSLGHHIGDMTLVTASDRMRLALRPGDRICRLGGDEFAVHLAGGVSESEVAAVASRLLDLMHKPMSLDGHEIRVTLSIGAAMGAASATVPELVRFADAAMYRAKHTGRDRFVMFDDQLRGELASRHKTDTEMRAALGSGQFEVHYQPEVELGTGRILGTEALVRWRHPERGLLTAGAFVDMAEDSGLIVELGRWVLTEATRQAAVWREEGFDIVMRANLSARQLRPAVVEEVREALLEAGLRPDHLCLEVTETAIMIDVEESMQVLQAISDLGVKLAIDDFGTGYSSLAYLKRFPVDILKIDKVFVDGVGINSKDTGIVDTVIRLGRALDLEVVAEGIENPKQIDDLRSLGCYRGQGFYLARPAPPDDIRKLLQVKASR